MAYLFKQKLDLRELAEMEERPKVIMIAEPEENLLALHSYYLSSHNFLVKHCTRVESLKGLIEEHSPHLLFFDPNFYPKVNQATSLLGKIRSSHPFLPIVTGKRQHHGTGYKVADVLRSSKPH